MDGMMTTTVRIKNIGLKPDAMLHATMLCNSVRLASSAVELVEAEAPANGFVVGLQVGGGISEQQKEQLTGLLDWLGRPIAPCGLRAWWESECLTAAELTQPLFDAANS